MSDSNLAALIALRRTRRVETDAARRDLGEAVTREIALAARDGAIRRELDDARRISGAFDREAFAAWLTRMHDERTRIADALRDAAAVTAAARGALAHRRLAETAAEDALTAALASRAAVAARREQVMLEDAARASRRTAGLDT